MSQETDQAKDVPFTIRAPRELLELLDAKAAQSQRSRNGQVVYMLRRALTQETNAETRLEAFMHQARTFNPSSSGVTADVL